jgi:hypothetical protein|tara:strand:+ start:390 stop:635 length:246 start_codon:yes stop_codon:yes gene_type:complete
MIVKIAVATAGLLGVGVGLTIPAFLPQADPATVNVVCESFEGPQGPAGKDGVDSTITFTHVPELEGIFHEQNVKIELQPIN